MNRRDDDEFPDERRPNQPPELWLPASARREGQQPAAPSTGRRGRTPTLWLAAAAAAVVVVVVVAAGGSSSPQRAAAPQPAEPLAEATASPTSSPTDADGQNAARRRFYLRTDEDAIALDDAIARVQDGDGGAVADVRQIRRRIAARASTYTAGHSVMSAGANLLMSAATTAQEAAAAADQGRLADTRADVVEARNLLAQDAIGG